MNIFVANLAGQYLSHSAGKLGTVDFSTVLLDVMVIADEVDSQLKQTVLGFMAPAAAMAASLPA